MGEFTRDRTTQLLLVILIAVVTLGAWGGFGDRKLDQCREALMELSPFNGRLDCGESSWKPSLECSGMALQCLQGFSG